MITSTTSTLPLPLPTLRTPRLQDITSTTLTERGRSEKIIQKAGDGEKGGGLVQTIYFLFLVKQLYFDK